MRKLPLTLYIGVISLFLLGCSPADSDNNKKLEKSLQTKVSETTKTETTKSSTPKILPPNIVIDADKALPMVKRGGDFTLYSKDGAVSLKDYRGKVVAIYFGYTQCPDVCPTNLALLGTAFKKLNKEELNKVQGIFISVDPGRDNPEHLAEYTKYFHPKIIGISGTPEMLDPVVAAYGAYYEKVSYSNSAMMYGISHTSETYIVGKNGKLSAILPHAASSEVIIRTIRAALSG